MKDTVKLLLGFFCFTVTVAEANTVSSAGTPDNPKKIFIEEQLDVTPIRGTMDEDFQNKAKGISDVLIEMAVCLSESEYSSDVSDKILTASERLNSFIKKLKPKSGLKLFFKSRQPALSPMNMSKLKGLTDAFMDLIKKQQILCAGNLSGRKNWKAPKTRSPDEINAAVKSKKFKLEMPNLWKFIVGYTDAYKGITEELLELSALIKNQKDSEKVKNRLRELETIALPDEEKGLIEQMKLIVGVSIHEEQSGMNVPSPSNEELEKNRTGGVSIREEQSGMNVPSPSNEELAENRGEILKDLEGKSKGILERAKEFRRQAEIARANAEKSSSGLGNWLKKKSK